MRVYLMAAAKASEREAWIAAIRAALMKIHNAQNMYGKAVERVESSIYMKCIGHLSFLFFSFQYPIRN